MRRQRLGERLRALILATPLIAVPACGNYNCDQTPSTEVLALTAPDGGSLLPSCPDEFGLCKPDGGYYCYTACPFLSPDYYYGRGVSDCSLVSLPDGGPGMSCTSTLHCLGGRRPASLLESTVALLKRAHRPGSMRTFGGQLRTLALAAPLMGGVACGSHPLFYCPPPPLETASFSLTHYDDSGSLFFPSLPANRIAVPLLPDGGLDCETPCMAWEYTVDAPPDLGGLDSCSVESAQDGGLPEIVCVFDEHRCIGGRRPVFLRRALRSAQRSTQVGRFFAETARLEAASIPAFHVLSRELREHGAPAHLVSAAVRSASDEVRHAGSTAALARRYGAAPIRPTFGPTPPERSLEAIATENAIEGCVRETYGALVALWQAHHAGDPVVAAAMAPIAADETRHAELAWDVAAWAEPRLSRAARRRIEDARKMALADLASEIERPVATSLVHLAGLPPPATARALLGGFLPEQLSL